MVRHLEIGCRLERQLPGRIDLEFPSVVGGLHQPGLCIRRVHIGRLKSEDCSGVFGNVLCHLGGRYRRGLVDVGYGNVQILSVAQAPGVCDLHRHFVFVVGGANLVRHLEIGCRLERQLPGRIDLEFPSVVGGLHQPGLCIRRVHIGRLKSEDCSGVFGNVLCHLGGRYRRGLVDVGDGDGDVQRAAHCGWSLIVSYLDRDFVLVVCVFVGRVLEVGHRTEFELVASHAGVFS